MPKLTYNYKKSLFYYINCVQFCSAKKANKLNKFFIL